MTNAHCQVYSPPSMPELVIKYDTRTGEVDITDAFINGQAISDRLYQLLIERNRSLFETAILANLKKTSELDAADQAGLDADIRRSL